MGQRRASKIAAVINSNAGCHFTRTKMRLLIVFLLGTQLTFGQTTKVKLFSFKNSTCDGVSESFRLRTRIIHKELSNGLLTVHIGATATCCVDFVPKATYKNGILNLDVEETGTPCECDCCYEFTYQINGIEDGQIKITFRGKEIEQSDEKYKTYPVQFRVLNGDTLNYVDKYGFRQGIWVVGPDTLIRRRYFEYSDNYPVRRVKLFPSGQIESELIREKISFNTTDRPFSGYSEINKLIEYYETGQKKRECYNEKKEFSNSYEKGKCKEWNEKGELIYEGDYRK